MSEEEQPNDAAESDVRDTPSRPAGYDPVDLDGIEQEKAAAIEARFKYLYKQAKDGKRDNKTLTEFRNIAAEQAKRIEELTSGFSTVVNHIQGKELAETESALRTQMRTAWEAGDNDTYFAAQDKLDDIRLEKKLASKEKPAPVAKTPTPSRESSFSDEDQEVVDAWQEETDENGQLLRPWAHNRGTDKKPSADYLEARAETFAVLSSPKFANKTMAEKMAEVDRRMGVKSVEPKQSVMGGNLTNNKKTGTLNLTPQQRDIAIRMRMGGTGADDAKHITAYIEQLKKTKKGAR